MEGTDGQRRSRGNEESGCDGEGGDLWMRRKGANTPTTKEGVRTRAQVTGYDVPLSKGKRIIGASADRNLILSPRITSVGTKGQVT